MLFGKKKKQDGMPVDMLMKFFPDIMDVKFTAEMEDKLDDIEYESKDWKQVLSEFYYGGFEEHVKNAMSDGSKAKIPDEKTDIPCDKCGTMMVVRQGRFGKFLACPNYPTCKNTKPIEEPKKIVAKCPTCGRNVLARKSKKGKIFYGCEGYPECSYVSWNIPANEKCPSCSEEMILKLYKNLKVISCPKCNYSRREQIAGASSASSENLQENNSNINEEIDILNNLDRQNEN